MQHTHVQTQMSLVASPKQGPHSSPRRAPFGSTTYPPNETSPLRCVYCGLTWMNCIVIADFPTPPPPTTTNLYVCICISESYSPSWPPKFFYFPPLLRPVLRMMESVVKHLKDFTRSGSPKIFAGFPSVWQHDILASHFVLRISI